MTPAMTDNEIVVLRALMRSATHYVEFGSGGSTVMAAGHVAGSIVSVDSSREWLDGVVRECRDRKLPIVPRCHHVDLGPLGNWGWPIDDACRARWPAYHGSVWDIVDPARIDLCLVDGRFRVASFLSALCTLPDTALIAIHDYTARVWYHVVEEFAVRVAAVDDLAVFRRRRDLDHTTCSAVIAAHAHDPR